MRGVHHTCNVSSQMPPSDCSRIAAVTSAGVVAPMSAAVVGIDGLPDRSEYAPDVATAARVGFPVRSEYAPDVATVENVGLPDSVAHVGTGARVKIQSFRFVSPIQKFWSGFTMPERTDGFT